MSAFSPAPTERNDGLVPITVCITPEQAVRLELLLAYWRDQRPSADDSDVIDAIFMAGLAAAELRMS